MIQSFLRIDIISSRAPKSRSGEVIRGTVYRRTRNQKWQKFSIILLMISLFNAATSVAQKNTDVIPPSPTAASLGKFVETPVSLYTGTPSIEVPVWEMKAFDLKLPVGLSYHAGGIKVDETASWVGLGWNLNAGGAITRTVRGLPDDDINTGFLNTPPITPSYQPGLNFYTEIFNYAAGNVDGEPDLFYFNVAGKHGKFVLDKSGNVHLIPYQKIKIVKNPALTEWTLTTEDGTIYKFGAGEATDIQITDCTNKPSFYTSTWYLSEIISPLNPANKIQLSYEPQDVIMTQQAPEVKYHAFPGGIDTRPPDVLPCNYQMTIHGKRLAAITSASGTIEFIEVDQQRSDVPGDHALNKIVVKDLDQNVVREFNFKYAYLNSRLMLNEVVEVNAGVAKGPYRFFYHDGLPPRFSTMQDHWGYYNGKIFNTTLLPAMYINSQTSQEIFLYGADRSASIDYAKCGTLKKIYYPTGGYVEYEYESHKTATGMVQEDQISQSYNLDVRSEQPVTYFSISNPTNQTLVTVTPYHVCEPGTGYGYFSISTVNGGGGTSIGPNEFTPGAPINLMLSNGDYKIEYTLLDQTIPSHCDGHGVNLVFLNTKKDINKTIGGLRIKEITSYDNNGNPVLKKKYSYVRLDNGQEVSTGEILNPPTYGYVYRVEKLLVIHVGNATVYELHNDFHFARSSFPNYPLGTTHGSHVAYHEVVEESIDLAGKNNGKSVYKFQMEGEGTFEYNFLNANMTDNSAGSQFPYPPLQSKDWSGGQLVEKSDFRRVGQNSYKLIKKDEYFYRYYHPAGQYCAGDATNTNCKEVLGIKAGFNGTANDGSRDIRYAYFKTSSGYYELEEKNERIYSYLNEGTANEVVQELVSNTKYTYNKNHLQPIRVTQTSSDQDEITTTYNTYPLDYPPGTSFIDNLITNHHHAVPIESVNVRKKISSGAVSIISGSVLKYAAAGNGLVSESYKLEAVKPVPATQFKFSNRALGVLPDGGTASPFSQDSRYKRFESYIHDANGNLIQKTTENNAPVSYLWDYNFQEPVAEIQNATYTSAYHTSFERSGQPDARAKTGSRWHLGNYTFTPPAGFQPVAGSVLSYWKWTSVGNSWSYHQQSYSSGVVNITCDAIDEVRITPPGSQMKTYTYYPLIGLQTSTDVNSMPTKTTFDNLGRLRKIVDPKGNITTQYQYRYKSQPAIN
jgi:hypothetical protein